MQHLPKILILLSLPMISIGCTPSTPPAPPVEQIAKIAVSVTKFPAGVARAGGCQIALTVRRDLAVVTDWLSSIDWSQAGIDLTVAKPPAPDGEVTITGKDGVVREFGFYWDGRVIDRSGNRLLGGARVAQLQQLAQRDCK